MEVNEKKTIIQVKQIEIGAIESNAKEFRNLDFETSNY